MKMMKEHTSVDITTMMNKMNITKQSMSEKQGLCFATIRDSENYVIVTYPIDCSIEVKNKFIHIRKIKNDKQK